MKKWIAICLTAALLILPLAGCASGGTHNSSGTELAKLLLANERLNAHLLKTEGDLLENGAAVLNTLAAKARTDWEAAKPQALLPKLNKGLRVSPTAGTFKTFPEVSNAYGYFENLVENITATAEEGARLIDAVKKNVRVVDMWITNFDDNSDCKVLLHVEENAETIIKVDENGTYVCHRYKNAAGKDVYELYQDGVEHRRATYIAGEHYELSFALNDTRTDCFVADNAKGFWETMYLMRDTNWGGDIYDLRLLNIKSNICYEGQYSPYTGTIGLVNLISADKKADLLSVSRGDRNCYTVRLSGFDGVKSVVMGDDNLGTLTTTSGKVLAVGDVLSQFGDVTVAMIHAGESAYGVEGMIEFNVPSSMTFDQFAAMLSALGFSCRRSMSDVKYGVETAFKEAAATSQYYRWNGASIKNPDGIEAAFAAELARFDDMAALYEAQKDADSVDYTDADAVELAAYFAAPTAACAGVNYENGAITADSVTLTLDDTFLFVAEQEYTVAFGLQSTGGLVHLTAETAPVKFAGGDTITVKAENMTLDVPTLAAGAYTPVAYIATADGIRSSACVPLTFEAVDTDAKQDANLRMSAAKAADNTVTLTFALTDDVWLTYEDLPADYAALRALFEEVAAPYGVPVDTAVEMSGADGSFAAMSGNETTIAAATYRLGYTTLNGDKTRTGYIYLAPIG